MVAVKEVNTNLGGKMDSMLAAGCHADSSAMLDQQDDLLNQVKDSQERPQELHRPKSGQIEEDITEMRSSSKNKRII